MKETYKLEILRPKKKRDASRLKTLFKTAKVVDEYKDQLQELETVKNPKSITHESIFKKPASAKSDTAEGAWVFFPWKNTLVHLLTRKDFERLRVSRNFNLIFPDEQRKFQGITIGIAGLNVGNPAALCLALEGGGDKMKFADFDTLSVSNLNRFRAGVCELGLNKAILSARQVYEINPFAKVEVFSQGLDRQNMEKFLLKPRLNVLVEEMDNLKLKIEIRNLAKKHKIPVVMVTGNGEDIILDVERFDLEPNLPLLNGHLKEKVARSIFALEKEKGSFQERIELARDFMGEKFLAQRLRGSFLEVGKSLAGIPQIAESSFLRGAAVCYAVRLISSGKEARSGRYALKLSRIFQP